LQNPFVISKPLYFPPSEDPRCATTYGNILIYDGITETFDVSSTPPGPFVAVRFNTLLINSFHSGLKGNPCFMYDPVGHFGDNPSIMTMLQNISNFTIYDIYEDTWYITDMEISFLNLQST